MNTEDVQRLRAEWYAAGRADQAPAGLYVHADTFVQIVFAEGVDRSGFRALYDRLLRQTHGARALAPSVPS